MTCLIEECSEVQKAATKTQRFGLYSGEPDRDTNNQMDIAYEFIDLFAVFEMLQEENVIPLEWNPVSQPYLVQKKKDKVEASIKLSTELGTLE